MNVTVEHTESRIFCFCSESSKARPNAVKSGMVKKIVLGFVF